MCLLPLRFHSQTVPFTYMYCYVCDSSGYRCYLKAEYCTQFSIVYDAFISINPLIGCYDTFATAHVTQTRIESCFKRINFSVIPIQCLWICIAFQWDIILNSQLHQLELLLPSNYSTNKMECSCNRFHFTIWFRDLQYFYGVRVLAYLQSLAQACGEGSRMYISP